LSGAEDKHGDGVQDEDERASVGVHGVGLVFPPPVMLVDG
jgi:hypothetical protein